MPPRKKDETTASDTPTPETPSDSPEAPIVVPAGFRLTRNGNLRSDG